MPAPRSLDSMGLGVGGSVTPGSGSATFSVAGTFNWTVPDGVYRVLAGLYGAGGGGPQFDGVTLDSGGMGGAFTSGFVNVTPGSLMPVVVGAGGLGKQAGFGNGAAGGDTTFGGLTAKGGTGGFSNASNIASNASPYVGGSGQVVSHAGGSSATGGSATAKGGGGAGGPSGAGTAGTGSPGAGGLALNSVFPAGGAGGASGSNGATGGVVGSSPGGGGGASGGSFSGGPGGGNGAIGRAILIW